MTHENQVACNSEITLLNIQTGQKTFQNLEDAKAVRDLVLQIRQVQVMLHQVENLVRWSELQAYLLCGPAGATGL